MVWSTDKANEWYKDKGWILGFNYLPATAVNSTEMWQDASFDGSTIEREMAAASGCGYNSCRVFLQYIVWKNEGELFLRNFERFLEITRRNSITVLPIFFDDCAFAGKEPRMGKQDEPKPGIHNSGWTPSPGFTVADDPAQEQSLKQYVRTLVNSYKNDDRIIAWDLYNEPGNGGRELKSLPLLRKTFEWARECNPSQPLTTGVYAWKEFDLAAVELSDIVSFHDYGDIENTKKRIKTLKQHNRPLLVTEWLHRPNGNTIETHMPLYKDERIGTYHWGLVNGKTQTHLNWDRSRNINGETALWQHDIFTRELKPYSEKEVAIIKELSGKFG